MTSDPISLEADRCVKCGLCLPHCPTYRIKRNEGDSPRGRIALIQGILNGQISAADAHAHLDQCLVCRACEKACPSGVRYGFLIDAIRARDERKPLSRAASDAIASLARRKGARHLLNLYRTSAVRPLLRRLIPERLRRLERLLPKQPPAADPTADSAPTTRTVKGSVALFTGCVSGIFEQDTLAAARILLERGGWNVTTPPEQGCCGAIHLHNGHLEAAQILARHNESVFAPLEVEAIISCASGCTSQLQEYDQLNANLAHPVRDICDFLIHSGTLDELQFEPLDGTALLHTPCSMKCVRGGGRATTDALARIPRLNTEPLPLSDCCGAAGSYLLTQPAMADTLRQPYVDYIGETRPDWLLTSNTGCAMHLRAGIEEAQLTTQVLHPIVLLARQLVAK